MTNQKEIKKSIEEKIQKIINLVLFFSTFIFIEFIIFYLFPKTTLAGIVCIPITLFVACFATFLLNKQLKNENSSKKVIKKAPILIVIGTCILLVTHPQERKSPIKQIFDYGAAYTKYNKICYNLFAKLTEEEKEVYLYKYGNLLPNKIILITILDNQDTFENSRIYSILYRNDSSVEYGSNNINNFQFIMTDSTTVVKDTWLAKEKVFNYFFVDLFENISKNTHVESIDQNCFIEEYKIEPKAGFQFLFNLILSISKTKAKEKHNGRDDKPEKNICCDP